MRFDELFESDDMLDALWDMHFDECTPIQEQAIPAVLEGRDLLACAQTGTGKTAAYLLPVIDMISGGDFPTDAVNCVIMAPTRELAQQIDQQLQGFAYYVPVSGMAVYGGTDGKTYEQQRKSLKAGADIVIATPGRLLAHLSMGYVDLSNVSFFILDEADRMLDMGFFDDIMQIIGRLPNERQTLLFSATMPPKIQQLANNILKDPVEIKLAVSKPAEKIKQLAYVVYETQKLPLLKHLFDENPPRRAIVFSSSKLKCKELARSLKNNKFKIGEMHSDLDQAKRDEIMLKFKAGKINVLVATDIVSRGIDVDDIELVVNYDVPHEAEDYVHRIGRTARADRDGVGITFISEKEQGKFRQIERLLEKSVEKVRLPEFLGAGPTYNANGASGKQRRRKKKPANKAPKPHADATSAKANAPKKKHHHRKPSNKKSNSINLAGCKPTRTE
ncbi:MAG: DEAD/DEAH box helicase [Clostridium sp.]|nr:DEAD/DEAH box helicase [Prevotella sp.]MCM1428836.1 DEAD/DEAH box helicase [Clostridium sp.]MCM1475211.1 DEAD/DEAH box helicase [Muribaculaceae bacterium]